MKIRLTSIQRKDSMHPKYGYSELVTIQCDHPDYKGLYISNFDKTGETKSWKVGIEIELEGILSKKYTDKTGIEREAWNWKLPSRTANIEHGLSAIKIILKQHDKRLKKLEGGEMINDTHDFAGSPPEQPEDVPPMKYPF